MGVKFERSAPALNFKDKVKSSPFLGHTVPTFTDMTECIT